jgi:hypothetical protein
VSLVKGTNMVRREHGIAEAECIAADPDLTLLNVKPSRKKKKKAPAQQKAAKKPSKKKSAKKKKR